ncbi:Sua5/YciO/YrdC/YwlC family protein [Kribbella sp. NPDC048928]|uniref:Sua5/YciO/YrdC/YwlC family protein n=1 Tax=Kribbella sp. NPDC048928 TaxID=3364111 RepID=UPI0037132090
MVQQPDGFEQTLGRAIDVLRDGQAVVVANPSPMTYGVVAQDARTVNVFKGRPAEQAVGISVHSPATRSELFRVLDLPEDAIVMVDVALGERISVLAPVRADVVVPEWLAPAVQDGWVVFFDGSWAPLAAIWQRFPVLYGSSANRSGHAPAATGGEARAHFPTAAVIVDADHLRTPSKLHGASTIIRVDPTGEPTLHRPGIQDRATGPEPLLTHLNQARTSV